MNIIGVNIKDNPKTYFFDSNNIKVKINDLVIIETEKATQIASVTKLDVQNYDKNLEIKNIIIIANKKDIQTNNKNIQESKKAMKICKELIEKYGLDMNLINANYTFDRKQLIFQFTSDNRVDFRELAKELASIFKTRIELRQIGVRDKAKSIGGLGVCGYELCCKKFLHDIDSVSINMAKNQGLALNPSKINGSCGRLLCCLKYEDCDYCEAKKGLPKVGDMIDTEYGKGEVVSVSICERKYKVEIPEHGVIEISLEEQNGSKK